MASIGLGFTLSANAQGMSSGINAGVVELQKLGYAAKKTQADVSTLKTIELSRVFLSSVQTVAGAFNSFVAGSASAVASVDDLSKRTGVSTQTLQAYQFAAEQSGVSVETFGKGVQKLGINLGEAQTGNKGAIKSFADLGLSVQELSRLSPEAAFEAVAAAISQLPGPAQQAAAAVSLFGKSGAELVPVFAEGAGYLSEMRAEAERLGLVLSKDQVQGLATLDDSIGKVSATFKAFQARVTAELAPSLIAAAESAATFIAALDVQEVAKSAEAAIGGVVEVARAAADAFIVVFQATAPLASTIFPIIADTLGFIASNLQGAALGGLAAAGAFAAYSLSCVSASAATAFFTAAITTLLSRTGVGLLVVVLGAAAGAFANYALAGDSGASEVSAAVQKNQEDLKKVEEAINKGTAAAKNFAAEAQLAFKLPAQITNETLLQGTVESAASAFKKFAQDAGNLGSVPKELTDAFDALQVDIDNANSGAVQAAAGQQLIAQSANEVLAVIGKITDARKEEEDATKRVAETSAKAAEEARKRVRELVQSGLPESEKSRLTLSQDLLAISQTITDSEKNLADARKAGDAVAIQQAQERLRLTQETAAAATDAARQQARDRELSSLGLDKALLKPVETVKDQFIKVRQAFDKGLVNGGEARTALQNLAAEGISIRKEIAAELARPSQQALQVNDIRTQEGASQFLALATGRQDPALEQRRAQLAKLEEIKQAIKATGANPVEILGA
jgi:hypothetical protein